MQSPRRSVEYIFKQSLTSIFQLETIQNHIRLTKEHINALEGRFASYQNPPGIFISEHEEWTQKLHSFIEVRESQ